MCLLTTAALPQTSVVQVTDCMADKPVSKALQALNSNGVTQNLMVLNSLDAPAKCVAL